jgi:ABC-type transport system substrate-binding protein
MNETMTSTAASKQHSTLRVVGAALVGVALGIAGVSLLSPAPADDASAAPPPAPSGEVTTPEPADPGTADPGTAAADRSSAAGTDVTAGSDAAAPETGVVDRATAEQAALDFLGEGRVTWVSPEDDHGAAWEIEVTLPSGREVDVYVDAAGRVVDTG